MEEENPWNAVKMDEELLKCSQFFFFKFWYVLVGSCFFPFFEGNWFVKRGAFSGELGVFLVMFQCLA